MSKVLARQARDRGDHVYIRDTRGESITYAELDRTANRLAHGLDAFGIDHQDPVLTMLPNVLDFVRIWVGLARRGAIEVPVNTAYRGPILSHLCNDSTAKTIIVDRQYLDRLEEIESELEHLECCVLYSEDPADRDSLELPPKLAQRCRVARFDDLFSETEDPFAEKTEFHDLHAIMYTSGTTGPSKGVMTTHAHTYCYANNTVGFLDLGVDDRIYTAGLPLFHVAGKLGMSFSAMIKGASVVLKGTYSSDEFWSDIAEHECTAVFLLGAVANFLWQQPETEDDRNNSLRVVGMVPTIPEYAGFEKRFGVSVATGYGSSECPLPCWNAVGETLPSYRCVGKAVPGLFEIKIFDEFDRPVPVGQAGEIVVRTSENWNLTQGYWKRPEATAEAFRNLWFHTGDSGYMDEEGYLYFLDRLTDSMRRRGENISSIEVEDQINQHPDVLECAVFGVWDEHTEQEVMAAITPMPDSSLEPSELIAFVNKRLPYFMVPRYIDIVAELPKTPTGKIQKYSLREKGATTATWDRVAAGIKLER